MDWAAETAHGRATVSALSLPDVTDVAAAYALQDQYVAATGKSVGGFKLAINGAAQMAHFGVKEGVSARIFSDEIYRNGSAFAWSDFGSVSVEPELCAVLGPGVRDITGPIDRLGAIACIDRFHAAIELIDQRGYAVPDLQLGQAIALNVFNAGIVLGDASIAPDALDLPNIQATLTLDGERVGDVTGAAPQDPIEAVAWLITHLHRRGVGLEPGMVVMCGTHIPIRLLEEHARDVEISMSGLGTVSFALTDR